jgi:cell wall-associated NlpC family hydrolase
MPVEGGIGGPTVRLWGRWWFGLCAAIFAVAVSGPAGVAAAAGAPPVRAAAEAVSVLAPGADAAGTGLVTAYGAAAKNGPYHDGAAVRASWARADAARQTDAAPSATASAIVRHVRLLHGAVRAREVWTSIALGDADGAVTDQTAGGASDLFVLGRRVHAHPGMHLRLHGWATLDVVPAQRTRTGRSVTEEIAGLRLTLLRDHDGLAAGTTIILASASAAVTIPPPPSPGGGSSAPPPKTHKPKPKPAPKPAPKPKPARHHHPSPPKPHRPVVHIPHAAHALINAAAGGRARVIAAALDQVGWPYIWGGDSHSEGGFDCSGLVDYAYARAGMALPGRPTAAVLWRMSAAVGPKHLQPGDLAFLYTRDRAPFHVALYVGAGLVVVAPHTGADVQIEPLSAVPWDGYGRLLRGGRGDGLARSVALAARRFAHPAPIWLDAAQVADALAARRVETAGERFDARLFISRTPVATPAPEAVPVLVPLASVRTPAASGPTGVAGLVLILVVGIAACVVRVPALTRRPRGD